MQEIFCKYINAKPSSKNEAVQLNSSNSIVGDNFCLDFDTKSNQITIKNKFEFPISIIEGDDSKELILWKNKGLNIKTMLAYIIYCEPKSQHEAVFLCVAFPDKYSNQLNKFCEQISKKLKNGNCPKLQFDKFEQNKIIESNGDWKISKCLPKPNLDAGCVIIKNKHGIMDKIIEAGRQKKPGCYIGSIIFLLICIGIIAWIILKLFAII